jgi:hypothetical protein
MSAGPPLPADLWDRLPPEARALILALRAEVADLRAKGREQQEQIQELHERLNQNSTVRQLPAQGVSAGRLPGFATIEGKVGHC